ncbi:GNAT family N-acetyltransferase [Streptomyces sp. L500]|uniref:GNAT family N-acetyltransferase n=1 Tax=Streptomyces abikoensis TaxID=97398 RepID=UPI00340E09B6
MLFPHTASRRLEFRPASDGDHDEVTRAFLRSGVENVSPTEQPTTRRLADCDAAFLVARRGRGDILGFSALHGRDQAGHIRCAVYLDPARARLGVGSEAIYLTINYAFAMFDVDRVIAQTTEATLGSVGMSPGSSSADRVLRDFLYFRGRHWDLHGFQLSRSEWEEHVDTGHLDPVLGPGLGWRHDPYRTPLAS